MVLGFVGPICDKYLNNIKISKSKKKSDQRFWPAFYKKTFYAGDSSFMVYTSQKMHARPLLGLPAYKYHPA
jgi:hypothetical protein